MEVDTGSNESGHKSTKVAARLTQRNETTFDKQTAIRLEEVYLLEMATQEFQGYPIWKYGQHPPRHGQNAQIPGVVPIGGSEITIAFDDESQQYYAEMTKKSADDEEEKVELQLIHFVAELQNLVKEHIKTVPLRSLHKRQGNIFRAQNKYRGNVWRDWAIIDWGEDGQLPNQMWGFVDLRALPPNNGLQYQGGIMLEPAIYGVVESATVVEDPELLGMLEIFVPITKEVGGLTQNAVSHLKFYLADVEAIVRPLAVIPDIGGQSNDYFIVKDRESWTEDFIAFLEDDRDIEGQISDYESDETE
jgi:hypothetical protein